MKNKNKSSETFAIAVKNNGDIPLHGMIAKHKNDVYELLMISKRKDMREMIFNARPDTKKTYYLLQLDHQGQVIKILSNPNKYEM